jgi:DNA invertase Pin-like site-specific DNA recombinase
VSGLALTARGLSLHVLLQRDLTLSEQIMTKPRSWTVTRGWVGHPGAQRQWDRAYQVVLHMAAKHPKEIAIGTAAWLTPKGAIMQAVAVYARVSTQHQAQVNTPEQQLARLRTYVQAQGWALPPEHVFRDDGYSGATLRRPGLDRLRDAATSARFERILITAPDRLARNYVHQVLRVEELQHHGAEVEFLDRPMRQDPHNQLLLQTRGGGAEYERTLINERMRRGRLGKLRAGTLLPWTQPPTVIGLIPTARAILRVCGWTRPRRRSCVTSSPGMGMRAPRSWASGNVCSSSALPRPRDVEPRAPQRCTVC